LLRGDGSVDGGAAGSARSGARHLVLQQGHLLLQLRHLLAQIIELVGAQRRGADGHKTGDQAEGEDQAAPKDRGAETRG
jgi:hypothetical protein